MVATKHVRVPGLFFLGGGGKKRININIHITAREREREREREKRENLHATNIENPFVKFIEQQLFSRTQFIYNKVAVLSSANEDIIVDRKIHTPLNGRGRGVRLLFPHPLPLCYKVKKLTKPHEGGL